MCSLTNRLAAARAEIASFTILTFGYKKAGADKTVPALFYFHSKGVWGLPHPNDENVESASPARAAAS